MYSVSKQIHKKYGNIIEIIRDESGEFESPFSTLREVSSIYMRWRRESNSKVRILIDSQVLTLKQAESWARNEYKELPKCEGCAHILNGDVFTHQLNESNLFCSQDCADKNYNYELERFHDNDETEFYCS